MNKEFMSSGIDFELFHNVEVWKEPVFLLCAFVLPIIIAIAFYAVLPDSLRSEEATDFISFYAPVAEGLMEGFATLHKYQRYFRAGSLKSPGNFRYKRIV